MVEEVRYICILKTFIHKYNSSFKIRNLPTDHVSAIIEVDSVVNNFQSALKILQYL